MGVQYYTRPQEYHIQICPVCGKSHVYNLEVEFIKTQPLILFGGKREMISPKSQPKAGAQRIERNLIFTCPETGDTFTHLVELIPDTSEEVHDVRYTPAASMRGDSLQAVAPATSIISALESEMQEWTKSSATTARDFCKTMLTTSAGAIPIYFAVLKYLDVSAVSGALPIWLGGLPPMMFLLAILSFVVALRPAYSAVASVEEFTNFRTRRFQYMNRAILLGIGVFTSGMLLAICLFVWLLTY